MSECSGPQATVPGDADCNGVVDSADLDAWRANHGQTSAPRPPGGACVPSTDFDNDGDTDGRDFLVWQRNFGKRAMCGVPTFYLSLGGKALGAGPAVKRVGQEKFWHHLDHQGSIRNITDQSGAIVKIVENGRMRNFGNSCGNASGSRRLGAPRAGHLLASPAALARSMASR